MSLKHQLYTLTTTPVIVTIPFANEENYSQGLKIIIQNLDQSKHVLLGSSSMTLSNYGYKLDPLASITLDLSSWDELYACADTGTLSAGVLRITK